jgi:hypothetical protein
MTPPVLPLTILFIEDPKTHGYTAFCAEYPDVIVEGDTKELAKQTLFSVMQTVFAFKKKQVLSEKTAGNVIISSEQYNAELVPA